MNDIESLLGYMSLRNTSEAVTYFERDTVVKIPKARHLLASVNATFFSPIFEPQRHRGSKRFMGQVAFPQRHSFADTTEIPSQTTDGAVLCIKVAALPRSTDIRTWKSQAVLCIFSLC